MAASSEERIAEPAKELAHKTKVIQFLGRTTPIILQNDNGPCPLLAICNVLLLKNNLNLSPDIAEVSQEKLLSLVAERLIDSNSNVDNKDAGYVENQQQNISDAIDLLPRLTTGIDVNIKFRRIDDFEFTRECAIFDLLDIPLYHGWIVDSQDYDTVNAIGLKSYNTLMGDLVGLETKNAGNEYKKNSEEDCVDFAAATTATLGVPSPCLSRGLSFDESPGPDPEHLNARKGDLEEDAELLRALKLSEADFPTSSEDVLAGSNDGQNMFTRSNESAYLTKSEPVILIETSEANIDVETQKSNQQEPLISDSNDLANNNNDLITFETIPGKDVCLSSKTNHENPNYQSNCEVSRECVVHKYVAEKSSSDASVLCEAAVSDSYVSDTLTTSPSIHNSEGVEQSQEQSMLSPDIHKGEDKHSAPDKLDVASSCTPDAELDSSGGSRQNTNVPENLPSSADGSEPIYEGEECILELGTTSCEDREPMYEGEVVLAEQVDKNSRNSCDVESKNEITPEQGQLIQNFLKSSASQLTIYGLFSLQDGLKERELCVFFRNNHFNTMFKFDGELYLLATDQGYINQPDLVWEKLNEVNGNTLFMTGNFKEFKVENQANTTWDEQNAMATTADYLASIDNPAQEDISFSSDLQLAIALQQQEFEQQPQRNSQQPTLGGGSRLVTGPQVSRSSGNWPSPSKPDSKASKDKCVVM